MDQFIYKKCKKFVKYVIFKILTVNVESITTIIPERNRLKYKNKDYDNLKNYKSYIDFCTTYFYNLVKNPKFIQIILDYYSYNLFIWNEEDIKEMNKIYEIFPLYRNTIKDYNDDTYEEIKDALYSNIIVPMQKIKMYLLLRRIQ